MKQVRYYHFDNCHLFLYTVAPTAAPQNLLGSPISPRILNYTWSPPPPDQQNGVIIHYVITVIEVDTGEEMQLTINTTWLRLDGLHPYYTYDFTLAAVTVSQGPFSDTDSVRMPEDGTLLCFSYSKILMYFFSSKHSTIYDKYGCHYINKFYS